MPTCPLAGDATGDGVCVACKHPVRTDTASRRPPIVHCNVAKCALHRNCPVRVSGCRRRQCQYFSQNGGGRFDPEPRWSQAKRCCFLFMLFFFYFFCCTSCCGSCCSCCCCCGGCSSARAGWISGLTVADASGGSSLRVFR